MLQYKYDALDSIPEQFQELYSEKDGAYVLTGVSGIKTQSDIEKLTTSLTKERNDHKATKAALRSYSSIGDPDDVLSKLDRIEELEAVAAGKVDDTKLGELVDARLKTKTAPLERQLAQLNAEKTELTGALEEYKVKEVKRTMHDHVRRAAMGAKVRDTALEDILLIGEHMFTVDEGGAVVTKDGVGVTPGVSADVWLTDMKAKRPHWWPESSGVGARGGSGGGSGSNPWSKDNWNITEQGRVLNSDRGKAEQLAKAAGTSIGGRKPS